MQFLEQVEPTDKCHITLNHRRQQTATSYWRWEIRVAWSGWSTNYTEGVEARPQCLRSWEHPNVKKSAYCNCKVAVATTVYYIEQDSV